jgi:orotidine-5'-phosphate decarboxylase
MNASFDLDGLRSPLCVALDFPDVPAIERVVEATGPHAGVFKVGLTAIYGAGMGIVADVARTHPVFLDAKLHDIPAQVEGAVAGLARLGPRLVSVHAAGGYDMVKAACSAAPDSMTVLAVTVLTSIEDAELELLGFSGPARDTVLALAERALDAGARGLVCSAFEVASLRKRFGAARQGGPLLVVPGIRPGASRSDDQRRASGARAALDAGADLLVVGRPITAAPDPGAAAASLVQGLR